MGHVDIFDCPPAVHGAFQTEHGGSAGSFEVISQYIPDTAGSFTAAGDKSCAFAGNAIAYNHVFRRKVHPQTVRVPTRFDADIIIVTVHIAVLNQNVA